jgi:SAM-dependent methyltransferase
VQEKAKWVSFMPSMSGSTSTATAMYTRHGLICCTFFLMKLREVIDANTRWSEATEQRLGLPSDKPLWQKFEDEAAALIRALPDGAVVLDLGGGRRCVYAGAVDPPGRLRLIAIDISAEELALNRDVAETHTANVAAGLPMPDRSVDLILSRALLEHVDGVGAAVQHMARVLKPGGVALHIIPCRYSLFGIAARLLPFGPLLRLTHAAMPSTRDDIGFDVHYDDCYPQALMRDFRAAGFRKVQMRLTWACPGYFTAFYPLFLAHALYEWTVRSLGIRRLAAYVVVKATR